MSSFALLLAGGDEDSTTLLDEIVFPVCIGIIFVLCIVICILYVQSTEFRIWIGGSEAKRLNVLRTANSSYSSSSGSSMTDDERRKKREERTKTRRERFSHFETNDENNKNKTTRIRSITTTSKTMANLDDIV